MKLRMVTGPMGVSAVKVSSSSWSCLKWLRRNASAFTCPGPVGQRGPMADEFAGVFIGLAAVEMLLGGCGQREKKAAASARVAAIFFHDEKTHCADPLAAFLASLALRREGWTHQATPMPIR